MKTMNEPAGIERCRVCNSPISIYERGRGRGRGDKGGEKDLCATCARLMRHLSPNRVDWPERVACGLTCLIVAMIVALLWLLRGLR
jgi:hypothetical protein